MFYQFLRVLANIAIRVFYGKIEVVGIENIPLKGPLLIASNHPNGFIEPIIMACLFPRPLHFMVRGDVFKKSWLKPLLTSTNQIPIYRFKDGFSDLRKNESSLRMAYDALDKDAAIILFIEGGTQAIKKLRPFQKGLGRMAYEYLDGKDNKQLNILPVGINFVSPSQFRSRVMLNVAPAIDANAYIRKYDSDAAGIKNLTDDLYTVMKPMAFHVDDDRRQDVLNETLRLAEANLYMDFPMVDTKKSNWDYFKKISDSFDNMGDDQVDAIRNEIIPIAKDNKGNVMRRSTGGVLQYFMIVLTTIPALLGLLFNLIPTLVTLALGKKVINDNNRVFYASILISGGVAIFFIYYLLFVVITSYWLGWSSILIIFGALLGFVYLWWQNMIRNAPPNKSYHLTKTNLNKIDRFFKLAN